MAFTTLAHHIDVEWLREAYRRTRKDGAPGWTDRRRRSTRRTWRQPPVAARPRQVRARTGRRRCGGCTSRRATGPTRPIGIPTFEDKVLQRAVVMVLEAVYEQDFLDCSYGFRPGRSAHQALEALWDATDGAWAVAGCSRSTSGGSSTRWIMVICGAFLDQRVRDGVLRRAIDKWLKAGVHGGGQLQRTPRPARRKAA